MPDNTGEITEETGSKLGSLIREVIKKVTRKINYIFSHYFFQISAHDKEQKANETINSTVVPIENNLPLESLDPQLGQLQDNGEQYETIEDTNEDSQNLDNIDEIQTIADEQLFKERFSDNSDPQMQFLYSPGFLSKARQQSKQKTKQKQNDSQYTEMVVVVDGSNEENPENMNDYSLEVCFAFLVAFVKKFSSIRAIMKIARCTQAGWIRTRTD